MAHVSHATPRNRLIIVLVSRAALGRLQKALATSAAKAARGSARTPKAYAKGNSLDVFRVKRFWSAMRPRIVFLSRAAAAILFSLRASAESDGTCLSSVRLLAQRQLNCAWVFGVVIYLHIASVRVLRCFFGDDSARAIILLPGN